MIFEQFIYYLIQSNHQAQKLSSRQKSNLNVIRSLFEQKPIKLGYLQQKFQDSMEQRQQDHVHLQVPHQSKSKRKGSDHSHHRPAKSRHKHGVYNFRQGICRHVPIQRIISYIQKFTDILKNDKDIPKLHSVENFRRDVHRDTIIRMYFQGALDAIPAEVPSLDQVGKTRPGILHGMGIDHVFDLINVVAQTPPSYSHSQFCGVPINALLIDMINTEFGKSLFSEKSVNQHLKSIFNDYGNMLRTKKSLQYMNDKEGGWLSPDALKEVDYNDFICDTNDDNYGFKNWNAWFTRQLRSGARPVDGEDDPMVIVHAAENYPLTTLELPYKNVKKTDKFWLKENRYSLYDMFEAQKMGIKHIIDQAFVDGTIYQGFLSPWCYHWWHAPVSGTIEQSYLLPGSYFLQNPSLDMSGINNYDNSQAFLSCVSARHVFIINTHHPSIGKVAIIEIGMVEVSSCIATVNVGDRVKKGDPIGRFEFGGSSHVIVFEKKANLEFNPKIHERVEDNGFELSVRQRVNTWLAKVI